MTRARRWDSAARQWLFGSAALFTLGVGAHAYAGGSAGGGPLQVVSCTSDAECDEGYECDLGPSATSSRDCPPDAGACEPTPEPEPRTGTCEPKEMTCEVDADCVAGLTCEHHDDSDCAAIPSSVLDGGTPADEDVCGPSEPNPGVCVYRFVECKTDGDCDGGFECTALGTESRCSSSDSGPCMPGEDCAQPEEEICTETTRSYCFPPRVDCDDDDDCDDGTRCVELSEDAQEDPPAAWAGATALCLPEAIALVLEERVEAAGVSSGTSKSANGSADESDRAGDSADGSDSDDRALAGGGNPIKARDDEGGTADAGPAGAGGSDDGGCTVSRPGVGNGDAGWIVLLGAAALYARRRRLARPR